VNEHFNFNSGGDVDIFGGDTMSLDLGIEKGCSSSEKTENNVLLPEAGTSAHSICVEDNGDVQKPCINKRNKKGAYICSCAYNQSDFSDALFDKSSCRT
jgi:hypothetical protein